MQAARLAVETREREFRDQMLHGAFVGWQVIGSFAGKRIGPFKEYAKGLLPEDPGQKITADQREQEIRDARERVRKARERFSGGVRKVLW